MPREPSGSLPGWAACSTALSGTSCTSVFLSLKISLSRSLPAPSVVLRPGEPCSRWGRCTLDAICLQSHKAPACPGRTLLCQRRQVPMAVPPLCARISTTSGSVAEAEDGGPCEGRGLPPLTLPEALSHLTPLPEWGAGTPGGQRRSAGSVSPLQSACVPQSPGQSWGGWQEGGRENVSSSQAGFGIYSQSPNRRGLPGPWRPGRLQVASVLRGVKHEQRSKLCWLPRRARWGWAQRGNGNSRGDENCS